MRCWIGKVISSALLSAAVLMAQIVSAQVGAQWVARYNGPTDSGDKAKAVAVDSSGNVYVTGESVGSGTGTDFATVKYGADGSVVWTARYNGPDNDNDSAVAIALDGSSYVCVTGQSYGSGTGVDYATVKYNATNGAEEWVARYNAADSVDSPHAIAVDSSGNVYVTGESFDSTSGYDYATVKYNASNGSQAWVARHNGPGNGVDRAYGIAVDGGSVYVTGGSYDSGTG